VNLLDYSTELPTVATLMTIAKLGSRFIWASSLKLDILGLVAFTLSAL
jgi:hypothetical protein